MARKKESLEDYALSEISRTKSISSTQIKPSRMSGFGKLLVEYLKLIVVLAGAYVAFSFFFVIEDAPLSLMVASSILALNGGVWLVRNVRTK
mgnify:CR=1 FL=1